MHTFATTNAAGQVERIDKLHSVHWFDVPDIGALVKAFFDFAGDAGECFLHLLCVHFLVVFLEEFFDGGEVFAFQFHQRFECSHGCGKTASGDRRGA